MASAPITTADEIKKFLPPALPDEVTDTGLLDLAAAAGVHISEECAAIGKGYSVTDPRDVLLETLLTAYIARQTIPGLASDDASYTARIWTTFEMLMKHKIETVTTEGLKYAAPVGPGGRAAENQAFISIFRAPQPWWDKWRTTGRPESGTEVDAEQIVPPPGRWE